MKNVQIIDGAVNCTYSIYEFTEEQFLLIFPALGQDVEFIEDVRNRLKEKELDKAFIGVWSRPVKKPNVVGIHGTLYYELLNKKEFYPSKSEKDVDGPPNSPLQPA